MITNAIPALRSPRFSRGFRRMSLKSPMSCCLVSVSSASASPRLDSTVSVTSVMMPASTKEETNVKK